MKRKAAKLLVNSGRRSLAALALALCVATSGGATCNTNNKGDPARSDTHLQLAKDYLLKGELEAAEADATKAIGFQANNVEAYNVRGIIHVKRATGDEVARTQKSCLTGLDAEALQQSQDKQFAAARADFAKATKLEPDFGEAWSNLGLVDLLLGDPDRAITELDTALQNAGRLVKPELTRTHLGWAYFQKQDPVQAFRELQQVLQFQPGMCIALYRLGRVYFAREEWEKAAEQFQDVSDDPTCMMQEALLYLMKARLHQGLTAEASKARDACVQRAPESCVAVECRTSAVAGGS